MTEPVRVLVADDHPIFRDGLAMLLTSVDGIEVVGTAADGGPPIAVKLPFTAPARRTRSITGLTQ